MIIRLPVKFFTFTLFRGKNNYEHWQTIAENYRGFKLVREEADNYLYNEIRYTLRDPSDKMLIYVRGFRIDKSLFYISKMQNLSEGTIHTWNISDLARIYQDDLISQGFEKATVVATPRIASILKRRYGFYDGGRNTLLTKFLRKLSIDNLPSVFLDKDLNQDSI